MVKILLGIVVVVLFLGMGYLWMQNQNLQNSIVELQNKPAPITQTVFPSKTPTPVDSRELLLPDEHGTYFSIEKYGSDECAGQKAGLMNFDGPNEIVNYKNDAFGLAFQIGYNKKWLSNLYRVRPYDEYPDSVSFGSLGGAEGCGMIRSSSVAVVPYRSAQEAIIFLQKEHDKDATWQSGPDLKDVDGLSVVEWTAGGLCSQGIAEVVGKKSNYQIREFCRDDFGSLEKIIETMKIY